MDEIEGQYEFETVAVHAGERRPGPEGSLIFPIYQGTVFSVEEGTDYHDLKYIRLNSTPSQTYLHDKLAALEGGEAAVATSSGMAAITTTLLSFLSAGDHLIASSQLYGGTYDFITTHAEDLGWSYSLVDPHDPDAWERARTPQTRVFLSETVTNPLVRVPRLREIVEFSHVHDLVSVIDNTFATPVNFNPLGLGFDVCCHSATKFLNGHSDIVAGCVIGSAAHVDRVRHTLNHYGASLDPHAGFLLARGLKTLAIRVAAQNANASALAEALVDTPEVLEVNYPGLATHPDHSHARELLSGFGGMLSFRTTGGQAAAKRLLDALEIATPALSLGGIETLVTVPALSSHVGMTREQRQAVGIADDLIRVSCGIEHARDLIEDFTNAITAASGAPSSRIASTPAAASSER